MLASTVLITASTVAAVLAAFVPSTPAHAAIVSPPPRAYDGMPYDEADGEVVLFGGVGAGPRTFNETWTWDGSTYLFLVRRE
jgi:hypothetical protein